MQQSYINNTSNYHPVNPTYHQNQLYIPISYQTIPTRPYNQQQIFNQSRLNAQYQLNNSMQMQIMQNKSNKWNIHQNNETNIQGFPFGKDRIKISNYVAEQMQISTDEENKRILQKFRMDAIKNRNQRVMKHLGKIPYVTESMMPGTSIDASRYVQKMPMQRPVQYSEPRYISIPAPPPPPPQPQIMPVLHKTKQTYPVIKYPRELPSETKSIGIQVDFQQQFPLHHQKKKKGKKNKRRYYTIEQQKQQQAINRIGDMLNDINGKLKKNSEMLTKSMIENNSNLYKSRGNGESLQNKFKYTLKSFFIQDPQQKQTSKRPSVQYSNNKRNKTEQVSNNYSKSLKDHLNKIKKNRRRLQDLDEYIYRI